MTAGKSAVKKQKSTRRLTPYGNPRLLRVAHIMRWVALITLIVVAYLSHNEHFDIVAINWLTVVGVLIAAGMPLLVAKLPALAPVMTYTDLCFVTVAAAFTDGLRSPVLSFLFLNLVFAGAFYGLVGAIVSSSVASVLTLGLGLVDMAAGFGAERMKVLVAVVPMNYLLSVFSWLLAAAEAEATARAVRRGREAKAVLELTELMSRTFDMDFLLQRILEEAVRLTPPAETGAIYLWDGETKRLTARATVGLDMDLLSQLVFRRGESLVGKALLGVSTLIAPTPESVQQWMQNMSKENVNLRAAVFADRGLPQGMVACPLTSEGQSIGVLVLHSFVERPHFTPSRTTALSTLANHAAIAIQNVGLYQGLAAKTEELNRMNEQLAELSVTDQLTKLGNRRSMEQHLEHEFRRALRYRRPLSVALFDIDHFKNINDTLGHRYGDYVLSELGSMLKQSTRREDRPYRYGGEEFLIVAPESTTAAAAAMAEKMRAMVEAHTFHFGGATTPVTISIGVASLRDGLAHPGELVELADQALYSAKESGRNRVYISTPTGPVPAADGAFAGDPTPARADDAEQAPASLAE